MDELKFKNNTILIEKIEKKLINIKNGTINIEKLEIPLENNIINIDINDNKIFLNIINKENTLNDNYLLTFIDNKTANIFKNKFEKLINKTAQL